MLLIYIAFEIAIDGRPKLALAPIPSISLSRPSSLLIIDAFELLFYDRLAFLILLPLVLIDSYGAAICLS